VFIRLRAKMTSRGMDEQRAQADGLARDGQLATWEAKVSLPDAVSMRTSDVGEALLTRSFRGAIYGTSKLWIKPASGGVWVTWLVKKHSVQPVTDLLSVALGERFAVRSRR
jgi:hypothetical protein